MAEEDTPPVDDRDGEPGRPPALRSRVDELFTSAMAQQLSEQRTLNRMLGRVDEALESIRSHLGDLERASGPDGGTAVGDLMEAVARIERGQEEIRADVDRRLDDRFEQLQATLVSTIAHRDDVDRLAMTPLLKRMEELREQLESRLAAHDDDAARTLAESAASMREHVHQLDAVRDTLTGGTTAAVDRLGDLLDRATRTQHSALETIEAASRRIEAAQEETREELAGAMAAALATISNAASEAADAHAEQLRESMAEVRQIVGDVGKALPERADLVATRLAEVTAEAEGAVRTLVDSSREVAQEDVTRLAETVGEVHAELAGVAGQLQTQVDELRTLLGGRLEGVAAELEQVTEGVADRFRSGLADRVEEATVRVDASATRLEGTVDEAALTIGEQLEHAQAAATGMTRAAEGLTPAVADVAEQLRGDLQQQVDRTSGELREAFAQSVESATAELRGRLEGLSTEERERVEAELEALQGAVARASEAMAKAVREQAAVNAEGTRTLVADASAQVEAALTAAGQQDRDRIEAAIAGLQETARRVGAGLEVVVAEHSSVIGASSASAVERTGAMVESAVEQVTARTTQLRETSERVGAELGEAVRRRAEEVREAELAELGRLTAAIEGIEAGIQEAASQARAGMAEQVTDSHIAVERMTEEMREALLVTAEEDRARIRQALADLRVSAQRVAAGLQSTMVEQTDAIRAASAAELAGFTEAVASARAMMRETVASLTTASHELGDTIEQAVRRMERLAGEHGDD